MLQGKTALITGAAKRLGASLAHGLAKEGINIVAHYHTSTEAMEKTMEELRKTGIQAWMVQADLGNSAEVTTLFQKAQAHAGRIDILINNASIFAADRVSDLTEEQLLRTLQINAVAPLLLAQLFSAQTEKGVILNLLEAKEQKPIPGHASYQLSKQMLSRLNSMLALELAPRIRVNGIAPGPILPAAGDDTERFQSIAQSVPLGRAGTLPEIITAALFLLQNQYITGQVVYVDGGQHL